MTADIEAPGVHGARWSLLLLSRFLHPDETSPLAEKNLLQLELITGFSIYMMHG